MELFIIIALLTIGAETTFLAADRFTSGKRKARAPLFVDTSVLIDGRIVSIAQSGFLTRPLYIPRSVVGELQFLADNADSDKRTRARHGLDVISQLQALTTVEVRIFADGVHAEEGVDNRLLHLAKRHQGALCTIDYNLNKVALVEGIEVLNVNDLAKTLRMAYLPGERAMLEITQKGNDSHQGVGHLIDGTMVVVEQAGGRIGATVEVEFIRSLQTAAGKMMFAKLVGGVRPVQPKKEASRQQVSTDSARGVRAQAQKKTPRKSDQQDKPLTPKPERRPQPTRKNGPRTQNRPAPSSRPKSREDSLIELANGS